MKKVAIISLPIGYNYGGQLQTYALMEILRRNNYDVEFIMRKRVERCSLGSRIINKIKTFLEKIGLSTVVYLFEKKTNTGLFFKTAHIRRFQKEYICKISRTFYDTLALKEYCEIKRFDYYICGSDQIWRREYAPSFRNAFLDFAPHGAAKISYAASLGIDKWTYTEQETVEISNLLNEFKAISVRELSAINLLNNNLKSLSDLQISHVLDPTLLLSKSDYLQIASKGVKRNGGILTYILEMDEKKRRGIADFASFHKKECFTIINPHTNENKNIAIEQAYPVEDWLSGFRDAEYVLTDSFHACVFSIIFEKQFYVFENEKRGNSRLQDLLKIFGLENRFVDSNSFLFDKDEIDWEEVKKLKNKMQQESMFYLLNALDYDS